MKLAILILEICIPINLVHRRPKGMLLLYFFEMDESLKPQEIGY